MRDIEVIDGERRLLQAIRNMVREEEGRPPSTARIDELLDELVAATMWVARPLRRSSTRMRHRAMRG